MIKHFIHKVHGQRNYALRNHLRAGPTSVERRAIRDAASAQAQADHLIRANGGRSGRH